MRISITLLGELQVFHDDKPVKLPKSKLTRALMVLLIKNGRPLRRDRLCDIFWDIPQDPRAALRWSLSQLRHIFNDVNTERLQADREHVFIDISDIEIDINSLSSQLQNVQLTSDELTVIAQQLEKTFLPDVELRNYEIFQQWLATERGVTKTLRAKVCSRLAAHPMNTLPQRLHWAQQWEQLEPLNPHAATQLVTLLDLLNREDELATWLVQLSKRFERAGITWSTEISVNRSQAGSNNIESQTLANNFLSIEVSAQHPVQYCQTNDGVRLAYTTVGEGPTIVKACTWLNNLQHDWDAPIWGSIYRALSTEHQLLRYDERGTGLSDTNIKEFGFARLVEDLETVIEANQLEKFVLLGMSQGAAQSIDYAVRHPERVSHLILFGAYAAGWLVEEDEKLQQRINGIIGLAEGGWTQDNPAFRQFFSLSFIPHANNEELNWFNEFQRLTTSAENAASLMSSFANIDVRHLLAEVSVPTLVIHSMRDEAITIQTGRDIAASIPGAEFVSLDSSSHLLLSREPGAQQFVEVVQDFITRR